MYLNAVVALVQIINEENCTLMPMLVNLQNKVDEFLDSITLEDIMKNNGKK